ncbi:AhpC/TSA family protein [Ulvibacter litoralis]|uniref:AhpC/TSA family protein n=2 Tax=Ulvibacter litoralis TaxID=227084 RepID=A0A1G7J0P4_9FLAO|nr:AhpC/TSA family protein [Ulvibacter litoralis]
MVLVVLQSCHEGKKEVSSEAIHVDETVNPSEEKIPSYNFDELEPLLNRKDDTTYVVNFWATWCKPCIEELPAFEQLNETYADQKVKVILVSLDFPEKLTSQVIPFIEKNNIQSEVVLLDDTNANRWIPKVSETWSGAIPATLIYKNNERKFYEQSFSFETLETEVKSIL